MLRVPLLATACLLLTFARAGMAADASALFADGERAFAAGDYHEALQSFTAAREAGSAGPSIHYNIGVCQYRLRDYDAAEATFAALAAEFPALRELAEYNRGLALRAQGNPAEARVAFERARGSGDDKIVALANAQLGELGPVRTAARTRWSGWFSGGLGYDDNVALVDEFVLPSAFSSSSPLAEALGLLSGDFGVVPLRLDATGYLVRYPDANEFDQSGVRIALTFDAADRVVVAGCRADTRAQHARRRRLRGNAWRGFAVATQLRRGLRLRCARRVRRHGRRRRTVRLPSRLTPPASSRRAARRKRACPRRLRHRAQRSGGPRRRGVAAALVRHLPTATLRRLDWQTRRSTTARAATTKRACRAQSAYSSCRSSRAASFATRGR